VSAKLPSFPAGPDRPVYGVTPRPEWLKVRIAETDDYREVRELLAKRKLHTVCEEAECPNLFECWGRERTATFLLMGDVCTRHCGFCAVSQGIGRPLDPDEPRRVADAVAEMGVRHAVVTSVNRDELPDGGAAHFAATIRAIRARVPGVTVEVLIPDFLGSEAALGAVLDERPDVLNHNLETVERLYRRVRPDALYARSLELLRRAATWRDDEKNSLRVKSGIMVGLGESRDEISATLCDLRSCGVDVVTVGQYLQPHARRLPIERYVTPEEFRELKDFGEGIGIPLVQSGPLVRSSYHARRALHSPSFPMASTGQESSAS
jgi:lipoic acid synthetase